MYGQAPRYAGDRRDWAAWLIAAAMLAAMQAVAVPAGAGIIVGNSTASGPQLAVDGNESASMNFNNNGTFLVAVITISSHNAIASTVTPTVSYNGVALTSLVSGRRQSLGWSAIYYLPDPAVGNFAFSVDFGASVLPVDNGAWEFGVISLSNVDETAPIASTKGWSSGHTATLTSTPADAVSAGDFVLVGSAMDYESGNPHWAVPTLSQTSFFYKGDPNVGTNREEYSAMYATLAAGDLSGPSADQLILTQRGSRDRLGGFAAVVFNAVAPEPASLGLMMLGMLALGRRSRRRSDARSIG